MTTLPRARAWLGAATLLLLLLLAALGGNMAATSGATPGASTQAGFSTPAGVTTRVTTATPTLGGAEQKVLAVLAVIDRTGAAPAGYVGGEQFMNDGRDGGQVLPRYDSAGRTIAYREWDVNPYTGANRGTERLVTGSDGSAWFTSDHYNTFVRVR
jgi:guanyl-specific ribonuclease Sa